MTTFQPGDIVLFEAPSNSLISRTIAALTNSSVSHAAIYTDKGTIIEMGPGGISENKIATEAVGQTTYIMRLADEPSGAPVVKAARRYKNEKIDYDYPSLLLICGLIVYREMKPNAKWKSASKLLLRQACVILDKLLNRMMKKSKHAMMCSQLAYQCYLDAGKNYRIHLKESLLEANNSDTGFKMIDALEETAELELAGSEDLLTSETSVPLNQLLQDLMESQDDFVFSDNEQWVPNTEHLALSDNALDQSLIYYGKEFLRKLSEFLDKTGIDIPLESLFVTPGDLLSHTSNLQQVAEVKTKRLPNP